MPDGHRDASSRPSRARFWLTIWLAVASATAYLCRNSLAVAEKTIREELNLTESQMGLILGPVFFWSYALTQIPSGWLGQRFGSRRILPLLSATWSLGTAALGLAHGFWLFVAGRLAVGVSQAGLFPCAMNTVSRWYPPTERGVTSGALTATMQIGGALAAALTGFLLAAGMRWQLVFALFAIPGLIWALGFWIWFRDEPSQHSWVNEGELEVIQAGRTASGLNARNSVPWGALLSSPAMWTICAQQFFVAAGVAFFSSWFPTYLRETRQVTQGGSGILLSLPLMAACTAALCGGGISDLILKKTGSRSLARRWLAVSTLTACGALVSAAYFITDATLATLVISLGLACAAIAATCSYAISIDMGGSNVAAVFATMNMSGNFGAGLLPWIVPAFRKRVAETPSLLELFGGNSWNSILVLFAVMFFMAALFWTLLRVDGTVFDQSFRKGKQTG